VANQSVSLKLTKKGEAEPEIVYAHKANGKWRSPGEGWLGPQSGIWKETKDGLYLMDPEDKLQLAFCKGLVYDTCYTLDNGKSEYKHSGGAGFWEVLGIFEQPATN